MINQRVSISPCPVREISNLTFGISNQETCASSFALRDFFLLAKQLVIIIFRASRITSIESPRTCADEALSRAILE
jgi:hypothetical protein